MPKVSLEAHEDIALLRLNNGVTNAISPELVDDLTDAVKRIKNESKGMVLAGGNKFFCIGLDLPTLLRLDRPDMVEFYRRFNQAVLDLYTLPIPTACAIDGHATAGGFAHGVTSRMRSRLKSTVQASNEGFLSLSLSGLKVGSRSELTLAD